MELFLATKQKFFFTKVAPVQTIADIGFLINTAPLHFILYYLLFFRKEYILFLNDYILVNTIFECCYLFFG